MNSVRQMIKLCGYQIRLEIQSKRVWMGFLIGIMVVWQQVWNLMQYINDTNEAVNVLEGYLYVGNNDLDHLFLALGWLLIVSDAPFVTNLSFFSIYRTSKKIWNQAMLLYMVVISGIYELTLVMAGIIMCIPRGYAANIWSVPMVNLASEQTGRIAFQYNINFPYLDFMKSKTIIIAFAHTFLCNWFYLVILGFVLYTLNLIGRRIWGIMGAFLIHFLGYELMKEGYMMTIRFSLLARSIPGLQIGGVTDVQLENTYVLFLSLIVGAAFVSDFILKKSELKESRREEKD